MLLLATARPSCTTYLLLIVGVACCSGVVVSWPLSCEAKGKIMVIFRRIIRTLSMRDILKANEQFLDGCR